MRTRSSNRSHKQTPFIKLDTHKCKACWECIESCPNHVINKIDMPWHKHARIGNPNSCKGCLKCIKVCQQGAYEKIDANTAV